jgi:hypothetical protein
VDCGMTWTLVLDSWFPRPGRRCRCEKLLLLLCYGQGEDNAIMFDLLQYFGVRMDRSTIDVSIDHAPLQAAADQHAATSWEIHSRTTQSAEKDANNEACFSTYEAAP